MQLNKEIRLPDKLSIFTAEAYAILVALKYALQQKKKKITILTDSMSCIKAVENMTGDHPIITRIANILHHTKKEIVLCWLPSHVGIFGNDQADRRAGRAIKKTRDRRYRYSNSGLEEKNRKEYR